MHRGFAVLYSRRWAAFFAAVMLLAGASAQEGSKELAAKRAEAFAKERAEAVKQGAGKDDLKVADRLKELADGAEKLGNLDLAALHLREARYELPYQASDIPKFVSRVIGTTRLKQSGQIRGVAAHPTKPIAASIGHDGSVGIWDIENGRLIRSYDGHVMEGRAAAATGDLYSLAIAWSPDGKRIATGGGNDIHVWDPETLERKQLMKGHTGKIRSLAFRPDSKQIASASDDRTVVLWDVETGKKGDTLSTGTSSLQQVAWDAAGKKLAVVDNNGLLRVFLPELPEQPSRMVLSESVQPGFAFAVLFAKDGNSVFTGGGSGTDRPDDNPVKQTMTTRTAPINPKAKEPAAQPKSDATLIRFDASGGGHTHKVTCLALSPDGNFLASGGMDNVVRVWDLQKKSLLRAFHGHADEVNALAFLNDNRTLISGSKDQSLRVWHVGATDFHSIEKDATGHLWTCAYSPDNKYFATAGADKNIYLYDAANNKLVKKWPAHDMAVTAIAFTPDNGEIVSAGGDKLVRSWSVPEGNKTGEYKGHAGPVMAIAAKGNRILSGGADKTAILWEKGKDAPLAKFDQLNSTVAGVDFHPSKPWLAVATADGSVRILDESDPKKELSRVPAHNAGAACLQFHPNQPMLATAGGDQMLRFWTVGDKGELTLLGEIRGHTNAISSLAFNSDGSSVATAGGDQFVKLWNTISRTEKRSFRGHTDWATAVAFAPDRQNVLSVSVDKTARVWPLGAGDVSKPIGHTRAVTALSAAQNGLVATASDDHTVKLWEAGTGKEVATFPISFSQITAVLLTPDGKSLFVAGKEGSRSQPVQIWDVAAKKLTATIPDLDSVPLISYDPARKRTLLWSHKESPSGKPVVRMETVDEAFKPLKTVSERELDVRCLNFSPDGEWAALGTEAGAVRVLALEKGERVSKGDIQAHQKPVNDVCLSPDRKRLVSGDDGGEVKVWDMADAKMLKTMKAHDGAILSIVIDPKGARFATLSQAGELRLWDMEKGEKLREWKLPVNANAMAFTSDGKLATANADSTVYLLELP